MACSIFVSTFRSIFALVFVFFFAGDFDTDTFFFAGDLEEEIFLGFVLDADREGFFFTAFFFGALIAVRFAAFFDANATTLQAVVPAPAP